MSRRSLQPSHPFFCCLFGQGGVPWYPVHLGSGYQTGYLEWGPFLSDLRRGPFIRSRGDFHGSLFHHLPSNGIVTIFIIFRFQFACFSPTPSCFRVQLLGRESCVCVQLDLSFLTYSVWGTWFRCEFFPVDYSWRR